MAKRTGFTVRMDNSDNAQRKYDISCDVTVDNSGARSVGNVNINRDGAHVANAHFGTLAKENPNVSVNFFNLPLAEHVECLTEVYDFVGQALDAVTDEQAQD